MKSLGMFLKFKSQEERKAYGGTCFVELQFCLMPKGTPVKQIIHSHDFWRDDSLYVHGDSPIYSTFKDIFGAGIHPDESEGYFDYYGITYYSPDKIDPIIERLLNNKPEDHSTLIEWLKEAKKQNGFYILGM